MVRIVDVLFWYSLIRGKVDNVVEMGYFYCLRGHYLLLHYQHNNCDWIKGKTGPFGPKPENWWGCGIFTILIGLLMFWIGQGIFKQGA